MITTAEIQTINYSSNDCTVRIPVFENASSEFPVVLTAKFISLPGIFNGYLVGDIVWVAFYNNLYSQPIVIGKVYQGIMAENETDATGKLKIEGGTVHCSDFIASNSAKLPADTIITGVEAEFNSLTKIISQLKNLNLYGSLSGADGDKIASAVRAVTTNGELSGLEINGTIYPVTASGMSDIINGGTADTPDSAYTSTYGGGDATSLPEEIPSPPTTDGTYTLQCIMENGIAHYRWISND